MAVSLPQLHVDGTELHTYSFVLQLRHATRAGHAAAARLPRAKSSCIAAHALPTWPEMTVQQRDAVGAVGPNTLLSEL